MRIKDVGVHNEGVKIIRYILCKVVYADNTKQHNLEEKNIYTSLKNEVNTLHGDYVMASLRNTPSFGVRYVDSNSGVILIRCQRSLLKVVQSSVTFLKKIVDEEAFLQTIHVGGKFAGHENGLLQHTLMVIQRQLLETQDLVVNVSGTIRSCLKFLIRYHRSQLPQLLMECKTEDEKKEVQAAIVKSCKRSTQVLRTWERQEKFETPKVEIVDRFKSDTPKT